MGRKSSSARKSRTGTGTPRKGRRPARDRPRFVGRDASEVRDHYPPRSTAPPPPPPLVVSSSAPEAARPSPSPSDPASPPRNPLITLERGFDVDQFSSLLGETSLRVAVPRDDLLEVLRRILEFQGFGVYVYSISVRPAPSDLLKEFVVELRRVEYSAERSAWVPFVEKLPGGSPP